MTRYKTITLKHGATLSLFGTVQLPSGVWSARASARTPTGSLLGELTVTLVAPVSPSLLHSISLGASATTTAAWPIGTVLSDIRFQDLTGTVEFGETFAIEFESEMTRA